MGELGNLPITRAFRSIMQVSTGLAVTTLERAGTMCPGHIVPAHPLFNGAQKQHT